MPEVLILQFIQFKNLKILSVQWPTTINQEKSFPTELGIRLRSKWMEENNITDVNVYFKDPVNSVRFIAPKVHLVRVKGMLFSN